MKCHLKLHIDITLHIYYVHRPYVSNYNEDSLRHAYKAAVLSKLLYASAAPPGFCNRGEVRYGSIGGLEYEAPQSRLYCLCINVALCSTALQCICRVIRRISMTMKAHTYYIIFGRPPIGGKLSPIPLAAPLLCITGMVPNLNWPLCYCAMAQAPRIDEHTPPPFEMAHP